MQYTDKETTNSPGDTASTSEEGNSDLPGPHQGTEETIIQG